MKNACKLKQQQTTSERQSEWPSQVAFSNLVLISYLNPRFRLEFSTEMVASNHRTYHRGTSAYIMHHVRSKIDVVQIPITSNETSWTGSIYIQEKSTYLTYIW